MYYLCANTSAEKENVFLTHVLVFLGQDNVRIIVKNWILLILETFAF